MSELWSLIIRRSRRVEVPGAAGLLPGIGLGILSPSNSPIINLGALSFNATTPSLTYPPKLVQCFRVDSPQCRLIILETDFPCIIIIPSTKRTALAAAIDSPAAMCASANTTVTEPQRTALRGLLLSRIRYLEWCCSGESPLCSRQSVKPSCIQFPDNCNTMLRCACTERIRCRGSVKRVYLILITELRLHPSPSPSSFNVGTIDTCSYPGVAQHLHRR